MGAVWRARDTALDREVALKEVRPPDPRLAPEGSEYAQMLRERMLREARALARLNHPHVVTVHHIVDVGPYPWLVMELVPGRSLQERLDAGALSPREAARIGAEVLSALRAAHRAGICHRDVKPANVLLREDGRAVLTDFGIAALQGSSTLTATGQLIGSPEYIAPERIRGTDDAPASDFWSLGMVLYVCVEGRNPLSRANALATLAAVLDEEVPPPVRAGALAPVLRALLVRDPDERPEAEQLATLLGEIAEGRTVEGRTVEGRTVENAAGEAGAAPAAPPLTRPPAGPGPEQGPEPRPESGAGSETESAPTPAPPRPDPRVPPRPQEPPPVAPGTPQPKRSGPRRAGRLALATGAPLLAAALIGWGVYAFQHGEKNGGDKQPDKQGASAQLPSKYRTSPLRIGLSADPYPPMEMLRAGQARGENDGVDPELAKALGKRLGVKVEFVVQRFDGLLPLMNDKRYDLAMGSMTDTPARRNSHHVDFVDYFRIGSSLYTKADEHSIRSWNDLCGKKVVGVNGSQAQHVLKQQQSRCHTGDHKMTLKTAADGSVAQQQVRTGEVDAAVADFPSVAYATEHSGEFRRVGGQKQPEPVGIAVSKGDPELRKAVLSALNTLIENGTYGKILAKWGVTDGAVKAAALNSRK